MESMMTPKSAESSPTKSPVQSFSVDDGSDYDEEDEKQNHNRSSVDLLDSMDWASLSPSPGSPSAARQNPAAESPTTAAESPVDRMQRELAEAVEDHDVETLRRLLPIATSMGNP